VPYPGPLGKPAAEPLLPVPSDGTGSPQPRSPSRSFRVRGRSGDQGQLCSSHKCPTHRMGRQHPRTPLWQRPCAPCPRHSAKHPSATQGAAVQGSHSPRDAASATGACLWPTLAPGGARELGTGFNPHPSHPKGRGEDRLQEFRQAHMGHPVTKLPLLSDLRCFDS